MEDKCVLPVHYPKITSWQWLASLFSVLDENEYALNWIYSNYIQLRFRTNDFFTDFLPSCDNSLEVCPYLIFQIISDKQISLICGDILDFIIKNISLSYYIYMLIDESAILKKREFGEKILHQLFIYGYDIRKRIFYVADYTFTNNYSYAEVSFDDVLCGFNNVIPGENYVMEPRYSGMHGLFLFREHTDKKYYELDLSAIKQNLDEYINSVDTYSRYKSLSNFKDHNVFGVSVYDEMIKMNEQTQKGEVIFDIRPLHILFDHKALMLHRIKYLMENKYISIDTDVLTKYEAIKFNVLRARNLYLKVICSGKKEKLTEINRYLQSSKENEIILLTKVRNLL